MKSSRPRRKGRGENEGLPVSFKVWLQEQCEVGRRSNLGNSASGDRRNVQTTDLGSCAGSRLQVTAAPDIVWGFQVGSEKEEWGESE